ncbi:MAG: serine/threonine-protein phosphatase, partial [Nitrospirae bacterium]
MPWRGAGQTDRGHVRSTNQDAFAVLNTMQVWIVADGMGGHAGGEIASHLAVEAITAYFRQQPQPSEYPALSEHHLSLRLTQA